jgi:Tfp pilus assembly protein PilV
MSSVHSGASREQHSARPREGFALPLAIMVLALLSIGLVAGFAMSTGEQAATSSQRAQARAYSYAQMGLEAFMTNRKEFTQSSCVPSSPYTAAQAAAAVTSSGAKCAFCPQCWAANAAPMKGTVNANLDTLPTLPESVTVGFANGKAFIQAVPVWLDIPNGRGTYFVRSTGTDNTSGIATGTNGMRTATRTVGVYVTWSKSTMNVMGALVSFSGVVKNGTGAVSGVDGCGADTNVAGITIPAEESMVIKGSGAGFVPTGNPPYDSLRTFSEDSAASRLDWLGLRNGTSITADIVLTSSTSAFPSTGTFATDTNYWPIIHVKNHDTSPGGWNSMWGLTNKGRGILIVDGDLDINGSNQWDGIVLVGGQLTSNGNNVTSGTVMSGLNRLLGEPAAAVDDASLNGTKSYVYNSCSVRKASSSMARYTMVPNTWMDNLAQY